MRCSPLTDSIGLTCLYDNPGVLTKVDMLKGRDNDLWMPVVRNEKEQLVHGYYVR